MDAELSRAEAELQQEEAALHTELVRLAAAGADIERRLTGVRAHVQEAAAGGAGDPSLTARMKATVVPQVHPDQAFDEARAARESALQTRRAVNAQVRQHIGAVRAQLTQLTQQVQHDERLAQQLSAQARQAAVARTQAHAAPPSLVARTPQPPPPPAPQAPAERQRTAMMFPPPPPPPGMEAKRVSPRVKMQAAIDLHSENNFFAGFSANISDGGLFVATVNLVPIGTEIDLTFTLPTGERISAHGVVRWRREVNDKLPDAFPGIGVQFTKLQDDAHHAITRFVASREPLFYAE